MIIDLLIIVSVLVLLLFLSMIWPPDSPWAPWWRTNRKTAQAICKLANITSKDIVCDLGCGDGELILQSAKLGAKSIGIEIDPLRVLVARIRVLVNNFNSNATIKRSNFFNENISGASVVVVYLVPKTLDKLIPKFKKELKKGTRVVSYKYKMNLTIKKEDKINQLYLYII